MKTQDVDTSSDYRFDVIRIAFSKLVLSILISASKVREIGVSETQTEAQKRIEQSSKGRFEVAVFPPHI